MMAVPIYVRIENRASYWKKVCSAGVLARIHDSKAAL
jgi:hypothetical protein